MSFWVQHGYGKGEKISDLHRQGLVEGVVLSPSSEGAETLGATAAQCQSDGLRVLLDPESYVYNIDGAGGKRHDEHGLDLGQLHWSDPAARLADVVDRVIEANQRLGTEAVIAPAPAQSSFGDAWTALSMQLAQTTIARCDGPVYVSVVVDSGAFSDWATTQAWLDALTSLDAEGVYLVVGWEGSTYPQPLDGALLENIFRTIYRLAVVNRYEVLWGYSDVPGAVATAAGLDGCASGWFHSQRLWSRDKWIPRTGGRQAAARVFSGPLASPLRAVGEADTAAQTSGAAIIPEPSVRRAVLNGTWGRTEAWAQHLAEIGRLTQLIEEESDHVEDRVPFTVGRLDAALNEMTDLANQGVVLDGLHQRRIGGLRDALGGFAAAESL